MASRAELKRLSSDLNELLTLRRQTSVSLNEDERRAERAALEAKAKRRAAEDAADGKVAPHGKRAGRATQLELDDGLLDSERKPVDTAAARGKTKTRPDALLKESAEVLSDELELIQASTLLAARVLPKVPRSANVR